MVTVDQRKVMLEFMQQHAELAAGTLRTIEKRTESKQLWSELARALNSDRGGAKKTPVGWSRYWSDFKNKLKNKVVMKRKLQEEDGGSPKQVRLSKQEKQALRILGPDFEKTWRGNYIRTGVLNRSLGHNRVSVNNDQLSAVVKLEATQEPPVVLRIPSDWGDTDSNENDKNSENGDVIENGDVENGDVSKNGDGSKDNDGSCLDSAESDGSFEEPVVHGVYPKWLMAIEKKRAEADYIRAKAEESRASASVKHAEAALIQAEALKKLASSAHTQAEAIMKIAIAIEDRRKIDVIHL